MSGSDHYKRSTCRACLSKEVPCILPLPATPVGDAYKKSAAEAKVLPTFGLDVYQCQSCTLIQLLDVLSPELLYGHFTYQTAVSLGLTEHFRAYAEEMAVRLSLPAGARVVDIGSNDGTLLRAFADRGFRVQGVDPARDIAQRASERGIPTIPAVFSEALAVSMRDADGPASLVVANNTMANVDDLDDFMRGIRTLLAPDGTFVMETGYGADVIARGLFDTIYHEHLSYFTVRSLLALAKRNDMNLADVQAIATKGGSLRAYFTHRPVAGGTGIAELLRYEDGVVAPGARTAEELATKLQLTAKTLRAKVSEYRANGIVAGYGTSVGTTTFNYTLGLGNQLDMMFDDNPVKFGTYSPGHAIPVLSSNEVAHKKPTAILVLAWRYTTPILEKLRAYRESGGVVIETWPQVIEYGPIK